MATARVATTILTQSSCGHIRSIVVATLVVAMLILAVVMLIQLLLPLAYRRRPVLRVQQLAFVPALFRAEIPGVEAGTPAMPGSHVGESRNGIPAFGAEETEAFIRDFLGTSIQAMGQLLLCHKCTLTVILQEALDAYKGLFEFVISGAVGSAHIANATRAKGAARNDRHLFLYQ